MNDYFCRPENKAVRDRWGDALTEMFAKQQSWVHRERQYDPEFGVAHAKGAWFSWCLTEMLWFMKLDTVMEGNVVHMGPDSCPLQQAFADSRG